MSQSYQTVSTRRQVAALAVMCLAVIVVIANVTTLNVAVPEVSAALRANQSEVQWMVDAYALLLAAFLLPAGALGDRFSRKGMLLGGLLVMTAAAVWSARAGSPTELIVARGAAGLGAAFVFPSTLSTITAITAEDRRGRAVALWSACTAVGGIVGLIGAGAILERQDWPCIFWAAAALSALTLVLSALVAVDTKDPSHAHLDPLGTVLSVVGIGGLVLGITEGPVRGWSHPVTAVGLLAGAAGLLLFVVWELHARRPLLDVRLFEQAQFGGGALAVLLLFLATFGAFFLCVQYVAFIFGYGPLDSGLAILPMAVTLVPASLVGQALARRWSIFALEAVGMTAVGASFLVLAQTNASSTYWSFVPGILVFGFGVGLCMAPATEAIVDALPPAKQGVASAVNDTARELGGALGIAVIGSVFNVGYRSAVEASPGLAPAVAEAVKESPAVGLVAARGSADVIAVVERAFIHGWQVSLVVAATVVGAGALALGGMAVQQRGRARAFGAEPAPNAVTAVPAVPGELAAEWERLDAMTDLLARATSSLAALQAKVCEQRAGLERLERERIALGQTRHHAAEVLQGAADELRRLAAGVCSTEPVDAAGSDDPALEAGMLGP